jgi:hypothetical protein
MRRTFRMVAGLVVATAMAPAPGVGASGSSGTSTSVTVTTRIADAANGVPLRVQSDGDFGDVYVTTVAGKTTTVESKIFSYKVAEGTDYFLTTYYSSRGSYAESGRTLLVDLSEEAAPGAFSAPDLGDGQVPVQLGVKCRNASPAVNMLTMIAGDSAPCPGSLRFWAPDGEWYRLSFQPANYDTSDMWRVTCTASSAETGCTAWTIAPSGVYYSSDGDPNPKSRNTLLRIDSNGDILEVGGDYYLSFAITLTR